MSSSVIYSLTLTHHFRKFLIVCKSQKPITVITRDNIRKLRPHLDPSVAPKKKPTTAILSLSELQKIKVYMIRKKNID